MWSDPQNLTGPHGGLRATIAGWLAVRCMYSLRKYLRLAIKGNPTALLPLYAPPGDVGTPRHRADGFARRARPGQARSR